MQRLRVFVTKLGVVSAAGCDSQALAEATRAGDGRLRPLSLFASNAAVVPRVGEVSLALSDRSGSRSHALALAAVDEVLPAGSAPPDAIVLGVTTGGMATTEEALRREVRDADAYRFHGAGTIAACLAERVGCRGPLLTVSTACSSGAVAIALGMALLRQGRARRVLAGGVDVLCRMTVHGFRSLQLEDPSGAHPMDRDRRGMCLGEAAALLLLEGHPDRPAACLAELAGYGLSCDAYHPSAPHPEGAGARRAMEAALADAGCAPRRVGYVNLHGTGTRDNDAAEARALRSVFGTVPPVSSSKGALGHTLGAAGALEAAITALGLVEGFLPANTGGIDPDPELGLDVLRGPEKRRVSVALSNSFGFAGNNAALVLSDGAEPPAPGAGPVPAGSRWEVLGTACLSARGGTEATLAALRDGRGCCGSVPDAELAATLPPAQVRRLKRGLRLALRAALDAHGASGLQAPPDAIAVGTAWGVQSETYDFLKKLFASDERFSSPTDFVNSVNNAPAGQAALLLGARGPNLTLVDRALSFEHALLAATVTAREGEAWLVMGSDEWHPDLSPLLDPPPAGVPHGEGAGALVVRPATPTAGRCLEVRFLARAHDGVVSDLVSALGGAAAVRATTGAILAGLPTHAGHDPRSQLAAFLAVTGCDVPVIDVRALTGHIASASSLAAVLAVDLVTRGRVAAGLAGRVEVGLAGRGVLVLGFGDDVSAVLVTGTRGAEPPPTPSRNRDEDSQGTT